MVCLNKGRMGENVDFCRTWTCDFQLSTLMLYLLSQEDHPASTATSSALRTLLSTFYISYRGEDRWSQIYRIWFALFPIPRPCGKPFNTKHGHVQVPRLKLNQWYEVHTTVLAVFLTSGALSKRRFTELVILPYQVVLSIDYKETCRYQISLGSKSARIYFNAIISWKHMQKDSYPWFLFS